MERRKWERILLSLGRAEERDTSEFPVGRIVRAFAGESDSEDEILVGSLRVLVDRAEIRAGHSVLFVGFLLVDSADVEGGESGEDLLRVTVVKSASAPLASFKVEAVHVDTFRGCLIRVFLLDSSRVDDIVERPGFTALVVTLLVVSRDFLLHTSEEALRIEETSEPVGERSRSASQPVVQLFVSVNERATP